MCITPTEAGAVTPLSSPHPLVGELICASATFFSNQVIHKQKWSVMIEGVMLSSDKHYKPNLSLCSSTWSYVTHFSVTIKHIFKCKLVLTRSGVSVFQPFLIVDTDSDPNCASLYILDLEYRSFPSKLIHKKNVTQNAYLCTSSFHLN